MKRELTNSELLEQYIYSVKMLLPQEKMDDIAAEIRSNLESMAEDRAMQLGRELTPAEMSAILKQHGHPMVVAGQYRDQGARGLISPQLFPLYSFTLRSVFGLWVTVRIIIAVFQFQGATPARSILLHLGRDVLLSIFTIGAGVTLLFALWEYLEFRFRYSQRWNPESLPPIPPPVPPPVRQWKPRPAVQIVGQVAWLIFWAMALFLPAIWWVWGGRGVFGVSDAVYAMRFPLWLLVAAGFAQSWLNYTHFATAEWRAFLRIALYIAGIILVISILHAGNLLVAGPNWNLSQAQSLATLNQMLGGVLTLACIVAGLLCVQELRRLIQRIGRHSGTDHQAA